MAKRTNRSYTAEFKKAVAFKEIRYSVPMTWSIAVEMLMDSTHAIGNGSIGSSAFNTNLSCVTPYPQEVARTRLQYDFLFHRIGFHHLATSQQIGFCLL